MKLSKVDLSNIIAIAHSDGYLQLLVNRGEELDLLEISAPIEAYEGLQELNEIVCEFTALPPASEPMSMLPVSSSMACAVGYDRHEQILQIEFHSGAVYQYLEVEAETWQDLYTSDSIGRFFNQEIKGRFESELIDIDDYCL
ncbi:MAG: KTSC domain-containing protein [Goleter apudmare HA4340-LM2]|jgi:hypothetical protein|nr:KTSC domain-containing protein [Goleter apudmare HA4340-LM2]